MKKAIILSDSHGHLEHARVALKAYDTIQTVFHLGDMAEDAKQLANEFPEREIYFVAGNNDFGEYGYEQKIFFEQKIIFLTHGHQYGIQHGAMRLTLAAKEKEADVVLFGHTHCPFLEEAMDMVLFNPGSISLPRNTKEPTFGVLTVKKTGEIIAEVYEFTKAEEFSKKMERKY